MSFSSGGSAEKANQQTQSQNDLPQWLKDAYQQNLASAQGIAAQGFTPYAGQMAAGDNDYLAFARDQAVGGTHAGRGQLDSAEAVYGDLANRSPQFFDAAQVGDIIDVNPERAQAGSLASTNLSAYLNPYQQQVVDQSNAEIDRQRLTADQQNAYAASQAGAFGGSRHGVIDAENARNFAQLKQNNTNTLLNQGYDRATGLATADIDRAMANSQFNAAQVNAAQTQNANLDYAARANDAQLRQAASIANAGIDQANTAFRLQAAQGLQGAALQRQNQAYQGAQLLGSLGGQLQATQQAGLDAAYQEFLRQQQDPFQRQELMNSAVFGIQQGGLTSSTSNSRSSGSKSGHGVGTK